MADVTPPSGQASPRPPDYAAAREAIVEAVASFKAAGDRNAAAALEHAVLPLVDALREDLSAAVNEREALVRENAELRASFENLVAWLHGYEQRRPDAALRTMIRDAQFALGLGAGAAPEERT